MARSKLRMISLPSEYIATPLKQAFPFKHYMYYSHLQLLCILNLYIASFLNDEKAGVKEKHTLQIEILLASHKNKQLCFFFYSRLYKKVLL